MDGFSLARLSPAARTLVFWLTLALIAGFGVAMMQFHNAYKFDVSEVIRHYRGVDDPENPEEPRSYGGMVMMTHAHALSVPLTYAALSLVFLGTAASESTKKRLIAVLFICFFLDWGSLWGLRYHAPFYAYVATVTGSVSGLVYLFMCGRILLDLRAAKASP